MEELVTNKDSQISLREESTIILSKAKEIVSNPKGFSVVESDTNFKVCLNERNLGSVFKGEHKKIAFATIEFLVLRFVDSFGFATQVSESRIETLITDFYDNFKSESLSDIVLFLKMARNGYFGATHRGLDSNLIFGDWFPKYLEQKAIERENIYIKEKSKQKESLVSIEDIRKAYQKLQNRDFQDRVIAYVEKITTGINRNKLEELIEEWENDENQKKWVMLLKAKRTIIKN